MSKTFFHWNFIEGLYLLLQPRKREQKFWLWRDRSNKIKADKKVYYICNTRYSIESSEWGQDVHEHNLKVACVLVGSFLKDVQVLLLSLRSSCGWGEGYKYALNFIWRIQRKNCRAWSSLATLITDNEEAHL